MTNERLEELKRRVERANQLSEDIAALKANSSESELKNLNWRVRDELFMAGRFALLTKKEAELESLLTEPKPAPIEVAKSATVSYVAQPDALDCCEGSCQP